MATTEMTCVSARPVRSIDFRGVVVLAAAVLALHLELWILPGEDSAGLQVLRRTMVPVESLLASTLLFYGARRSAHHSPQLYTIWSILALAQACAALGDVVWLGTRVSAYRTPLPAVGDILYILYYPVFLLGASGLASARARPEPVKQILDLGAVIVGAGLLVWTFFIGPLLAAGFHDSLLVLGLAAAYPACDLALLLVLMSALLRPTGAQRSAPLVLLAAGAAVLTLTHACFVYQFFMAGTTGGRWQDLGWGAGCLLAGLAGALQAGMAPQAPGRGARRPASWPLYLPYLWLAAALGLVAWSSRHPLAISTPALAAWAGVIGSFMLGRQTVATREHEGLYDDLSRSRDELEVRVAERTAELKRINQDLYEEMHDNAQLFVSLETTNRQLMAALQSKDEMLQNVSHELRTPLMLILGYVELLHGDDLGPLQPEQADAVDTILRQGQRLRFMVNRLLTLQTFDADKLRLAPLSVGPWIEEAVEAWQVRAAQAGIALTAQVAPDLPEVMADRDFLGQVLENLLDNAVKFTPEFGHITVQACAAGKELIVSVADGGVGIPPDKLDRVFERFYQVDGKTNRRFGGMGIGLALCRTIIEAHHGRLWAESRGENQGATFCAALPLN